MSQLPGDRRSSFSLPTVATILAGLLVVAGWPRAAQCGERTFVVTPAEIAAAIDDFNGQLLVESAGFPKKVRVFRGGTKFARVQCPSLTSDATRMISRLVVLDTVDRAADWGGRGKQRQLIATVLSQLGADTWQPPASHFSSTVPGWSTQALVAAPAGLPVFQATGFGKGRGEGLFAGLSPLAGYFRFALDLSQDEASADGAFSLVMALTSETIASRSHKPKLTQCFFLMELVPADLQELERRLTEAAIPGRAGERLQSLLSKVETRVAEGKLTKAKGSLADFAGEVGDRMGAEIDVDVAARLIRQSLRVIEAL